MYNYMVTHGVMWEQQRLNSKFVVIVLINCTVMIHDSCSDDLFLDGCTVVIASVIYRIAGNFRGTKYSWFSNIETFRG